MRNEPSQVDAIPSTRFVTPDELDATIERSAGAPAQGGSASAAPLVGLIVSNQAYNRYVVQLADDAGPGQPPAAIDGQQVVAINLAEPFDATGTLAAGTAVLVWPSQGLYTLFCPPSPAEPPVTSYWATIVSGGGPSYTIRRQSAASGGLGDASGAADVSADNVWELAVDPAATAAVPAGAIVRAWEETDSAGQTHRFFFYAIHSVYR